MIEMGRRNVRKTLFTCFLSQEKINVHKILPITLVYKIELCENNSKNDTISVDFGDPESKSGSVLFCNFFLCNLGQHFCYGRWEFTFFKYK